MDSVDAVQQAILVRLSSEGKEAVLFTQVQQELHADAQLVAAALRTLLETRRVSLRRGSGADTQLYLSLASDLSESLSLVLDAVRASGTHGIDQAQLLSKLRLPKAELLKALQALLAQKHIREHRSYTNRAKRIYLLYHLEPSTSVTGGTFYCGEELDVALVDELRRRLVAYVEQRRGATLEQLVRFVEDESSTSAVGENGSGGSRVGSPITFIRSSGGDAAVSFAATSQHGYNNNSSNSSSMSPATMTTKRISPRDVQTLVRTLVLDGVLECVRPRRAYSSYAHDEHNDDSGVYEDDGVDVMALALHDMRNSSSSSSSALQQQHAQSSSASALSPAALAMQYRLSSGGCNVMRHFTAQPKRSRSSHGVARAGRSGEDGDGVDVNSVLAEDDGGGGVVDAATRLASSSSSSLLSRARRVHKLDAGEDNTNMGDGGAAAPPSSSTALLFARERAARRHCVELLSAEAMWQPAAVSAHSAGAAAGQWSYMPAVGFPCLGCPLLASCSTSGKGVVSPAHCAYLAEWLA